MQPEKSDGNRQSTGIVVNFLFKIFQRDIKFVFFLLTSESMQKNFFCVPDDFFLSSWF